MASLKMMLVLVAVLFCSVWAHPTIGYEIHSMNIINEGEIEDDAIEVTELDDMTFMERAPREKAAFTLKKVETGYARTTNVGLTVQKGTAGIIKFRIRVKAVTTEQLAIKAKLLSKLLTKAQKIELKKLSDGYDGGFGIPWLKLLGVDLSKPGGGKILTKTKAKILGLDKLAVAARFLLKEIVAQKIEVKGILKAKGVSFIPTTVFSFIRIAKVQFTDASKLLVLSKHPGDVKAATSDGGTVVPTEVDSLEII